MTASMRRTKTIVSPPIGRGQEERIEIMKILEMLRGNSISGQLREIARAISPDEPLGLRAAIEMIADEEAQREQVWGNLARFFRMKAASAEKEAAGALSRWEMSEHNRATGEALAYNSVAETVESIVNDPVGLDYVRAAYAGYPQRLERSLRGICP